MKRSGSESAERDLEPQKRPRNLGHELRILIHSQNAGSIIGKGGANINRLRSENKATINLPSCSGPERVITIATEDENASFNVVKEIVGLLEEEKNRLREGSDSGGRGTEVRLLLHHSHVGAVIGKGGAKVKELRESSGAHIKVYGRSCPRSSDRVVAVAGTGDVLLAAIKQIVALTADTPVNGMNEQYDPYNYDEVYAAEYGGFGERRGDSSRDRHGDGRMGARSYSSRGSRHRDSRDRDSRSPDGGRRRSGRSRSSGGIREREERITNKVTIPKEYAGAIIGTGGSRIRRTRADSGASITIDEARPGDTERIITISGAPGQIRMAQYLLQQSVKDHGELIN